MPIAAAYSGNQPPESEDRLNNDARQAELAQLVARQKREDRPHQDPQRFAGVRTVSLEKFIERGRDATDLDIDTVRDSAAVDHGATEVGGVARPLARWGLPRVHPIHRPRTMAQRDALFRACEDLLENIPTDKRDAVRFIVYAQLSERGAAELLGIKQPSLHQRLYGKDRIDGPRTPGAFDLMRTSLEVRSGSEGMDFPPARRYVEADACRAPKCDGHFKSATCDVDGCITVLPKHYNPHTTCRTHTRGQSRAEFNQAFIIGTATRGGQDARSAAVLSSAEVEAAAV